MVKTRYISGILTALSMSLLFGCGGSSGSEGGDQTSTGKSLQIEGGFDTEILLSAKPLFGVDLGLMALPAGDWKVRCVPSSGPNISGEGTVNSEGGFAVVMNGVSPTAAIGCFLIHNDLFYASLVFGQTQNLNNDNINVMSIIPGEDTKVLKLGTNISLTAGQIVLDPADFDYGTPTPPAPTETMGDLTGSWKVAKVYSDGGFTHPCDMESTQVERDACRAGWQTSLPMYVNMVKLNKGAASRYTLSLWESSAHFNACGKSEALSHDGAWSVDAGSVNGATATTAFNLHIPALNNLGGDGDTVLADAKFAFHSREVEGVWEHNCPLIGHGVDPSTVPVELALCQAATSCASFTYSADEDGSAQKVNCVLSSLRSGGPSSYWPSNPALCASRASSEIWSIINGGAIDYDDDGKGCADPDCGVDLEDGLEADPKTRMLFSEFGITGAFGTGTTSTQSEDRSIGGGKTCPISWHQTFEVTKTGTNTLTLFVTNLEYRGANWDNGSNGTEEECMADEEIQRILSSGPTRLKIDLQKM